MSLNKGLDDAPRRILIVDDTAAIHDDYRRSLGIGSDNEAAATRALADLESDIFGDAAPAEKQTPFVVVAAFQGEEALELVRAAEAAGEPFATAFIDMRMPPGWDGLETIERIWKVSPDLQCVICTAYSDYSFDQMTARLGKRDNLLLLRKPFDPTEVLQIATAMSEKWMLGRARRQRIDELERLVAERTEHRMEELERIVADRTEQLRAAALLDRERVQQLESRAIELRRAAMTDRLTDLPNRALFNDRLSEAVQRSKCDPEQRFAVLYLDFDRFKVINDSLGHEIGDKLLIAVSRRLVDAIRDDHDSPDRHVAARLGGDEFVALLTDCDLDLAVNIGQRILDALSPPFDIDGHSIHCAASIGVTTSQFDYECAEDIVRDADTAMYRAKAAGRARVSIFNPRMHQEVVQRMTLETNLRKTIEAEAVEVHFQPIVRIADGKIGGFEALARWRHPNGSWISPVEFIPVAEETGLILDLGESIMRKAFCVAADWRRKFGFETPYVSVNLSPKQLMDSSFMERVERALIETGASPRDIKFELTEGYLMTDTDGAVATLSGIRDRGFGLLIDDFGTGYSSLSSLHRFPFTGMKIDRSFLLNTESVRNYVAVLETMVALAGNLGIDVIAEGVENTRQLALLESVRCGFAQGFYFAGAMVTEDAERAVRTGMPNALTHT